MPRYEYARLLKSRREFSHTRLAPLTRRVQTDEVDESLIDQGQRVVETAVFVSHRYRNVRE
jgi:hypothetical protein